MAKEAGTVVVSEEATKVINQEGAGSGLTEELQKVFLNSLSHITTGQLGEEIDKLEQKKTKGELTAGDLPILNQLTELFKIRKFQLQVDVARVFGIAAKGDLGEAERLANRLI